MALTPALRGSTETTRSEPVKRRCCCCGASQISIVPSTSENRSKPALIASLIGGSMPLSRICSAARRSGKPPSGSAAVAIAPASCRQRFARRIEGWLTGRPGPPAAARPSWHASSASPHAPSPNCRDRPRRRGRARTRSSPCSVRSSGFRRAGREAPADRAPAGSPARWRRSRCVRRRRQDRRSAAPARAPDRRRRPRGRASRCTAWAIASGARLPRACGRSRTRSAR